MTLFHEMAASVSLSRRTFAKLGVLSLASLSLASLAGCASEAEAAADASDGAVPAVSGAADAAAQPEQRGLMGSPDPCDVRVGSVIGPPAMGLSQFIVASKAGKTTNRFAFDFSYAVDYSGLVAAFNQGEFDLCVVPSNLGPILYNNRELKNEYQVVSVNNLGLLYVATADPSVDSLESLIGRTVYGYGAGGTPEYTVRSLLSKLGLGDSLTLEFKTSPFEVLNLMQQDPSCVAILPQPFVSLSKTLVSDLRVPVNLTQVWNEAFAEEGSQAVTTITLANKAFLAEHEQAVVEYLNMAGQSVQWTLGHKEDAAALQEELGTFLNNEVALDAMPTLSMVNMTGVPMREALSGFLAELYRWNPESVGGSLPDDGFYYLPPANAVADETVGVAEATAADGKN